MADEKVPGPDYDIRGDFVVWGDVLPLVAQRCKAEGVKVDALMEVALNYALQSFLQKDHVADQLLGVTRALGGDVGRPPSGMSFVRRSAGGN